MSHAPATYDGTPSRLSQWATYAGRLQWVRIAATVLSTMETALFGTIVLWELMAAHTVSPLGTLLLSISGPLTVYAWDWWVP